MRNNSVHTVEGIAVQRRSSWAERRDVILTILGWLVLLFVALEVLQRLGHVFLLAAIAAVIAFAVSPLARFAERVIPRFLAILVVYLLFAVVIIFPGYVIINTGIHQLTSLSQAMRHLFSPGESGVTPVTQFIQRIGISQQQLDQINQQVAQQFEGFAVSIIPFATSVVSYLLDLVLIIVLSIYFLVDGERLVGILQTNMPVSRRENLRFLLQTLQRVVGGYIRGQLAMSTIIGLLVWIGMSILGVPYAQLLGIMAFILEFIPILGTLLSGVACVLLAFTHGLLIALIALGYFVVVHVVEADILGPRIVGKSLGLHPVVSILAVIAGSELAGITGALFAAPVAGIGQALLVAGWEHLKVSHAEEFVTAEDVQKTSEDLSDGERASHAAAVPPE